MKNFIKIINASLCVALGVFLLVKMPLSADAWSGDKAFITLGRQTFGKKCANCHGKTGKGESAMAKRMKAGNLSGPTTQGKSDEELTKIINDGVSPMPGYAGKLSDEEIKGLVDFLRTL